MHPLRIGLELPFIFHIRRRGIKSNKLALLGSDADSGEFLIWCLIYGAPKFESSILEIHP